MHKSFLKDREHVPIEELMSFASSLTLVPSASDQLLTVRITSHCGTEFKRKETHPTEALDKYELKLAQGFIASGKPFFILV